MIIKVLHLLFLCTFASPLVMGCGTNEAEIPDGPIGEAPAVEEPDARHIYLWDEGKMPMITEYTVNNGNYQDNPDFRPNIVWYPVPEGTAVKGAVMVCPGGAFMFRSGNEDSFYRHFNQNVEAVRQTDRSAGGVARAGRLAARLRCAGRMDHVVRQFPHRSHDKRRIRRHKL